MPDWLARWDHKDWIEIAKLAAGLVVFGAGLYQYWRAQVWKRLEFVAAEMAKFRNDPKVAKVCLMLDWSERRIDLGILDSNGRPPRVTYEIVAEALVPHTERGRYHVFEAAIRDHFDEFLGYLAHLQAFVDAGLISHEDLKPYLRYWTNAMAGGDNVSHELLVQLWKFIDAYQYSAVRKLVTGFHPDLMDAFPPNIKI